MEAEGHKIIVKMGTGQFGWNFTVQVGTVQDPPSTLENGGDS